MNILIVRMWSDDLNINSYNCQEIGLAKALIRKNNKCDIILYTSKEEKIDKYYFDNNKRCITIYYLNAITVLKNTFFNKKLYDICKNYDIIQSAEYDQIGNLLLSRKFSNFYIYHGPYKSTFTKGYNKKTLISDILYLFFPKYKKVPIISKSVLATKFLLSKGFKNITTVGVGIDLERFEIHSRNTNEIIKEIAIDKKKNDLKYLLYIGKLEERRNIIFLLDRLLDNSREDKRIRLIIVGNGEDKYKNDVFNFIEDNCLKDKIIYFEKLKQDELPALYSLCDVFLLPTKYEIFGMVLLEAMYFGIPIITTNNGGSSIIIEHNKNGFIYSLDNIDGWNNCIKKLLCDNNLVNTISKNSRETILTQYTWDIISNQFIDFYKKNFYL